MTWLIAVLGFLITIINPEVDRGALKFDILNIALFFFICIWIGKRTSQLVAAAVFAFGVATIKQFALHKGFWVDWNSVRMTIRYANAEHFYSFFMALVFLVMMPREWYKKIYEALPWYGLMICCYNIYTLRESFPASGSLVNWSLSGQWGVILYPFLHKKSPWFFPVVLASTLATFSSIPIGLLLVFCGLLFLTSNFHRTAKLYMSMSSVLVFAVMWVWQGEFLFDSNGRFYVWRKVLEGFLESDAVLTGVGGGSLFVSMAHPKTMQLVKEPLGSWMELHNDWLQVFVSAGGITLLLVFLAVVSIICKHYKDKRLDLFQACVLLSIMAVFSFPGYLPIVALLSGVMFFSAFKLEGLQS